MCFSLIAATLAVASPILASPLVTGQDTNPNCTAMAAAQSPAQKSDFSHVCAICYNTAADSCAEAEDTRACTESRILDWAVEARGQAVEECQGKGTASATQAYISEKVDKWAEAGNCKTPTV